MISDDLLGADQDIDRQAFLRKQFRVGGVLNRADTRNFGWDMKLGIGDLAGNHVGFIAIGYRNNHVSILCAGLFEDVRVAGVAAQGHQIEAILKIEQGFLIFIDDDNVIGFASEIGCERTAYLSCAENDDFHGFIILDCTAIFSLDNTRLGTRINCCFRGSLTLVFYLDPEAFELAVHMSAFHPGNLGELADVATGIFQSLLKIVSLELFASLS